MNVITQPSDETETRDLRDIEQRCAVLRRRRDALRVLASAVNDAIGTIKQTYMPQLREAVAEVAEAEAAVRDAVQGSEPALWLRNRTRIIHGIKAGWQKQRGRVEMDDEAKTIERIRKLLPAEQAELLIRVRESVHKPAVYDLTAADMRRLGITITDDSDVVIVRDIESELDRAIEALLAEITAEAD